MDLSISINSNRAVVAVLLLLILPAVATPQAQYQTVVTNLCDVVASPHDYSNRVLTLQGILLPSEHSLALYSPSCKPREGFDVTTQAVLPRGWESLPNGKQLRKFLKKGKEAHVELTGTFESGTSRYGPDAARFRFVVSGISTVKDHQ